MLTDEEVSNQQALLELAFADLGRRYQGAPQGPGSEQFAAEDPYPVRMAPSPSGGMAYDLNVGAPQPAQSGDVNWSYGAPTGNQTLFPRKPEGTFSVMGGSSSGGYAQVQNLAQLKQIMGALQGVPPGLRDKLITQLTGIPFKGERQVALESAIAGAQAKHQLEAPSRQAAMDLKLESLMNREEQQANTVDYRQQVLDMRREALQGQKINQMKMLVDAGNATTDPKLKAVLAEMLSKLIGSNEVAPMQGQAQRSPKIKVTRVQ